MKKKSTELTTKEKQNLIYYCTAGITCNDCAYNKICDSNMNIMVRSNTYFEIDLLPEHQEKRTNMQRICKHCKQEYKAHLIEFTDQPDRCPLVDYEGKIAPDHWDKTFFEPKKTEVDKLIKAVERFKPGLFFLDTTSLNKNALLNELKALRKED